MDPNYVNLVAPFDANLKALPIQIVCPYSHLRSQIFVECRVETRVSSNGGTRFKAGLSNRAAFVIVESILRDLASIISIVL